MATRQFAAGEFDAEEFEQLDKLLGSDWVELDDAQFIKRVEKAVQELPNSSPGPSASTHGPLGDAAAVDNFFAKLLTMLNSAIGKDPDAAAKIGDSLESEAQASGLTKAVSDIAKRGGLQNGAEWTGRSNSPADPSIRKGMLEDMAALDDALADDPKELQKAKGLGVLYRPPSGTRVRKNTLRPVRKSTATLDQAVTALTKALRTGTGAKVTLE